MYYGKGSSQILFYFITLLLCYCIKTQRISAVDFDIIVILTGITKSIKRLFCLSKDALWDHPDNFNVTGNRSTAGIFATYPGKHLTILNGFFDQVSTLTVPNF